MNAAVNAQVLAQLKLMQEKAAQAAKVDSMEQQVTRAALEQARAMLAKVNKITNAKMRAAMQQQVMIDCNVLRSTSLGKVGKRIAIVEEYTNLGGAWGAMQASTMQEAA